LCKTYLVHSSICMEPSTVEVSEDGQKFTMNVGTTTKVSSILNLWRLD